MLLGREWHPVIVGEEPAEDDRRQYGADCCFLVFVRLGGRQHLAADLGKLKSVRILFDEAVTRGRPKIILVHLGSSTDAHSARDFFPRGRAASERVAQRPRDAKRLFE